MAFDLDDEELRATREAKGLGIIGEKTADEIEAGEYVRTNKGNIGMCIGIFDGHVKAKYHIQFQGRVKVKRQWLSTKTIIKHSKNIIDLIEVGDYVNGYKVISVDYDVPDKHIECIELDLNNNYQYNFITINQLKSIVTKEQFKSIEYKGVD